MSKIRAEVRKADNAKSIHVFLDLEYKHPYEVVHVSFKSKDDRMNVHWSSAGSIMGRKVIVPSSSDHVELSIEHSHNLESFECLVSYLQGDDLRFYETLVTHIERSASVSDEPAEIPLVSSIAGDFQTKDESFKNKIIRQTSAWRTYISVRNDIQVDVKAFGTKKIFVSFGELAAEVTSSDFIFTIEPRKYKFMIPKEVFWSKYDLYTANARLCICQLVQADFHSVEDTYYKTLISNMMPVSAFPRSQKADLRNFRSPIGRQLHKYWMIDSKSNLPVFRK